MSKSYRRFYVSKNSPGGVAGGFFVGLADFACLGWKYYDLAGYPYDDENQAIFSDWVSLGEDAQTAGQKLEESIEQ